MKKIIIYLFLFSFFVIGCGEKVEKIPADIMSRDSMISILADIQLVEANIQLRNLGYTDSTKNQAYGYYKFVLLKHKTDPKVFEKSFHYYTSRPDMMSKMYTDVLTVISQQQVKIQELQKVKTKRDTIK